MTRIESVLRSLSRLGGAYRVQLALCVRVTVAAVSNLLLAQALQFPLYLWAVLTAVILSQVSFGRSLKATIDYLVGTLGGVAYAGVIGLLTHPRDELSLAAALAIAVAPVALLAAFRPAFTVAPFTAVLVILAPTITHISPIESAYYRLLEVLLGGATALVVSLLVFPARALDLTIETAARMLDVLAGAVGELFEGFNRRVEVTAIDRVQNRIGETFGELEKISAEAKHERITHITLRVDPGPLLRTLLRLRHDFVMIGRAAIEPLHEPCHTHLGPEIQAVANEVADYLRKCSAALLARRQPPPLGSVEHALDAYATAFDGLRNEGLLRGLPSETIERIFALSFVLEQLRRNIRDLQRCIADLSPSGGS
jgi:uncharacterized membrane protein YccC